MANENPSLKISTEQKPWTSPEEIQKSQLNCELSQKYTQINNILKLLDLPDDIEESYREILETQDTKTLKNLAWKSKSKIVLFVLDKTKKKSDTENQNATIVESEESGKQNTENDRIDKKLAKIKSVFPSSVLEKHPDIASKLNFLDSITDPLEKDRILQEILQTLKNPSKLRSIINDLGGASPNNPKYKEFKNTLTGIDSSFEGLFDELENITLNPDDIAEWIEKDSWWMIDIDLKANPPVSKMSLAWSSYSFDKAIDMQAISKVTRSSQDELDSISDSFVVLKNFGISFDALLNEIGKIWWQENFGEKLKDIVSSFSRGVFDELDDTYETMGIKSDIQIKEADISDLANTTPPENLKFKIENIREKLLAIKSQIWETQAWILENYKTEIKELLDRKSGEKEKQLEVLQFMKSCGFDLIPKEITDRIIREVQSNTLTIPGLDLNKQNIDLENWHFGESSVFIDQDDWLNIQSKTNLVKFVNKSISWNIDEPLPVVPIVNWSMVADPAYLENKFVEAGIVGNMGWKYERLVVNLRNWAKPSVS